MPASAYPSALTTPVTARAGTDLRVSAVLWTVALQTALESPPLGHLALQLDVQQVVQLLQLGQSGGGREESDVMCGPEAGGQR